MSTRIIALSPEQDAYLEKTLETGGYRNASEVVGDALRALQLRREEDELRLERLRMAVTQGLAALDSGKFTEVGDEELETYLDDLAASSAD